MSVFPPDSPAASVGISAATVVDISAAAAADVSAAAVVVSTAAVDAALSFSFDDAVPWLQAVSEKAIDSVSKKIPVFFIMHCPFSVLRCV